LRDRIYYAYPKVGTGRAACAVRIEMDPDGQYYGTLAVAWCSPKDHFAKKRGRAIAEGRLKTTSENARRFRILFSANDIILPDGKVQGRALTQTIHSTVRALADFAGPRWATRKPKS
jgi:hypothetical protein